MVFAISLSHGEYVGKSFILPINIRLITYTHPRTLLDGKPADHVFFQVLKYKSGEYKRFRDENDPLIIKPEIIDLENVDSSPDAAFEITCMDSHKSVKQYNNTAPGTYLYAKGQFYVDEPCSECEDLRIEFNERGGLLAIPGTYMQVKSGKTVRREDIREKRISFSGWIREISEFYKEMFPGKVINVMHLSCRWEKEPYVSVNELTRDINMLKLHKKERYTTNVDGRAFETFKCESFFLKKSEDVKGDCHVSLETIDAPIHISKDILVKRKRDEAEQEARRKRNAEKKGGKTRRLRRRYRGRKLSQKLI